MVNNLTTSTKDTTNSEMILDMISKLTKKVEELQKPADTVINPRTGTKFKQYCWSCGCCTHWGKDCPQKKPGHQDAANFENRMGGSNKNYLLARQ